MNTSTHSFKQHQIEARHAEKAGFSPSGRRRPVQRHPTVVARGDQPKVGRVVQCNPHRHTAVSQRARRRSRVECRRPPRPWRREVELCPQRSVLAEQCNCRVRQTICHGLFHRRVDITARSPISGSGPADPRQLCRRHLRLPHLRQPKTVLTNRTPCRQSDKAKVGFRLFERRSPAVHHRRKHAPVRARAVQTFCVCLPLPPQKTAQLCRAVGKGREHTVPQHSVPATSRRSGAAGVSRLGLEAAACLERIGGRPVFKRSMLAADAVLVYIRLDYDAERDTASTTHVPPQLDEINPTGTLPSFAS
eukprot:SAG31_NODE_27_length_32731_cov_1443.130393_12_plen_305_part_00